MIPLLSLHSPKPSLFLTHFLPHLPTPRFKPPPHRTRHFPIHSFPNNQQQQQPANQNFSNQQPRTLFPGGYKRPEIKVPNIVLQLDPEDVIRGGSEALDLIDKAVSKSVGIVILNGSIGGGGSGKSLYEAACLVNSVVRDRAYLLIGERVDIATAVNASGVVLSDQGLPAIVARNMMMGSRTESVVLPLVARIVQTPNAALKASNSEGADFLIYVHGPEEDFDSEMSPGFGNVKIPIFVLDASRGEATLSVGASKFRKTGASGLVLSLEDLRLFSDDALSQMFDTVSATGKNFQDDLESFSKLKSLDMENDSHKKTTVAGFVKLEDREKQLIEKERSILLEAIDVIQKASPLTGELSLFIDAVSQIDEPFLLAIVGEFNSGKSTVINALLGKRYLNEGVVPTTNEITFLRYSKSDSEEQQRCERHPDGQYICYLPAPILKEMNIVDTPGTNVILQRQQSLTEEFVPRADLLLFVISADRPLTESEVSFLRYTQQWKKKVVFVLNKSDLYRNSSELEEAMLFIKENTMKLLKTNDVILYPISARSALEAKLSASSDLGKDYTELSVSKSHLKISRFFELEQFLYSFLDASTTTGMERIRLKLETPIAIAERLLSACETLVKQDSQLAKQDLTSATELIDSVKEYAIKMENESISWRRKTMSLIDATKSRVLELIESTLQLSNLDLVASYIFRGEKPATMPATIKIQNDIIGPALTDAQKLLGEYLKWLHSNSAHGGKLYKEQFEKRWTSITYPTSQIHLETHDMAKKVDLSIRVIENLSAVSTSKLLEKQIREAFLGTFGGLGAAGLSASLLTSVLPTTLEDLLALGLCSAGG
ncbi:transmembrane GTPase FZO-like [Populus alba x Populus x berolinensis]|uniref:Transmembrane GTPase FZO-like n=1 Tax=Populus alba x Populus x berolinensis TaxID=444605 RepID=A0AAD6W404_9ROSI|nr:transmembrane GTPase FZO-like [Populus alba x Populus x berolinensis]